MKNIYIELSLTHHILGEPDPTVMINVDSNSYAVERGARQVNEVPAPGSLIDHALLYVIDVAPGRCRWPCQADAFATIRESSEPLIGNAHALVQAIRAGVA